MSFKVSIFLIALDISLLLYPKAFKAASILALSSIKLIVSSLTNFPFKSRIICWLDLGPIPGN